ncbi:ABC transporter permease [bacterium]|nr:ABC transporter permease [bacterium]
MLTWIESLGSATIQSIEDLGRFGRFMGRTAAALFYFPVKFGRMVRRVHFIGSQSLWLIVLIGGFTGAVLGLQVHYTLVKFGAESRVGTVVALSLIRELGPVICALMVAGRAGSSLASELGIMQITEQIDAFKLMGLDPFRYFMAPILAAAVVSVFLLTAVFDVVGILGGFAVTGGLLGVPSGSYFGGVTDFVVMADIRSGAFKSMVFGVLIAWVSTYKGYHTGYGAEGVSRASTETVVLSSVLILISDYVMTSILFQ